MASSGGVFRQIALSKETVRGTVVAPTSGDFLPHEGFDFVPKSTKADNKSAMGSIAGKSHSRTVQKYSEGNIPLILPASKLGAISNLIMGQAPTTTGSDPYDHEWSLLNDNEHLTYTATVVDSTDTDIAYGGAMLNTFELNAGVEDFLKGTLGMIAFEGAAATVSADYIADDVDFVPSNIVVKIATDYAGLGAASAIDADSLTLSINKNAVPKYKFGDTSPYDIKNGRINIDGDFSILMTDSTYRDLSLGDGSKALSIEMTEGSIVWTFILPSVDFSDWSDESDIESSAIMESLSFHANALDETNGFLEITLADATATY